VLLARQQQSINTEINIGSAFLDLLDVFLEASTPEPKDYIGTELNLDDVNLDTVFALIKSDFRSKAVSNFQAYNKSTYTQSMTPQRFLGVYGHNCKELKTKQSNLSYLHFRYILGIPVMVFSKEVWKSLHSSADCGGMASRYGILIMENSSAKAFLSHEMTHALVEYWVSTGLFKQSGDINFDLIRNEGIAYLLNNGGQISGLGYEKGCYALSRHSPNQLSGHPHRLKLVENIIKVDQGNTEISRIQMARTLLMHNSINSINIEINRILSNKRQARTN
jgi:hypothetical protein